MWVLSTFIEWIYFHINGRMQHGPVSFWIHSKMFKSIPNYWHRVSDITSVWKRLESSSGHTRNFYPNWVQYRFKKMFQKESLLLSYTDLIYKLRTVNKAANFISSGSKIVKRLRRRQYNPVIIERTIGLVLGPSKTLYRLYDLYFPCC